MDQILQSEIDSVNDNLRRGIIEKQDVDILDTLVNAIENTEPCKDLILYRGYGNDINYIFNDSGVLFKSEDINVAKKYASPYIAVILYKGYSKHLYMDKFWNDNDKAVLTYPNEKFKLIKIEGDIIYIESITHFQYMNNFNYEYKFLYQPMKIEFINNIAKECYNLHKNNITILINGEHIKPPIRITVKEKIMNIIGNYKCIYDINTELFNNSYNISIICNY